MKEKVKHRLFRYLTIQFLFLMVINNPGSALALDVNGIIDEDRTFSIADSPVHIIGDVLIAQGATLTIEPGVTVGFQSLANASRGFLLDVEGTLDARGNVQQPILFTAQDRELPWASIVFRDVSQDWNGSTSSGSILSYCILEYGDSMIVTENAMPRIANNAIRFGASVGIAAYFSSDAVTASGNANIIENQIYNNPTGLILSGEGGQVLGNYFLNNEFAIAISARSKDIEFRNNTIVGSTDGFSGTGLYLQMDEPTVENDIAAINIEDNVILSNTAGGRLIAISAVEEARYSLSLTGNNLSFTEGEGYAVFLFDWPEESPELKIPNNWWGTNDPAVINRLIYDQSDDFRLPVVNYMPFADMAFTDVGSQIGYPVVANAGQDIETAFDQSVTLDGSGSYDPEGMGVYHWQQVDGPSVTIDNADRVVASFIAPSGGIEGQEMRFTLTVYAGSSFPNTDEVIVSILPDELVPYVEAGGGCFLQSTQSQFTGMEKIIATGMAGVLLSLVWLVRRKKQAASALFLILSICITFSAEAGFLAVGGGDGGEAERFNITMETGSKDLSAGNIDLMFAFGFPFIPHGDTNIPEKTIALPCPNNQCTQVAEVRKGTEIGMYGKLGFEIGSTNLYLNAIGGFTAFTESQLVQSPGSGFIYEQSSDTTLEPLYGAGFSYFPDNLPWQILIQVDYDITRGVTGTLGLYW